MENYKDHELSEMLGLESFKISILKEITKSVEVLRNDFLSSNGWSYELSNRYYDFYLPNCDKYKWNFEEKLKTHSDVLSKDQNSFLSKIPFIDFKETNIKIKYNNKWLKAIQTKTHLILI